MHVPLLGDLSSETQSISLRLCLHYLRLLKNPLSPLLSSPLFPFTFKPSFLTRYPEASSSSLLKAFPIPYVYDHMAEGQFLHTPLPSDQLITEPKHPLPVHRRSGMELYREGMGGT